MTAPRWRIRRCNGHREPWIVSHPKHATVRCFPTYETAREYVLLASGDATIPHELAHLRRLTPRRTA